MSRAVYDFNGKQAKVERAEIACGKDFRKAPAFSQVTIALCCQHGMIYGLVMQKEAENLRRLFEIMHERLPRKYAVLALLVARHPFYLSHGR